MEFTVKTGNPEKQRSACVVVGVYEGRKLSAAAARLDQVSGGQLVKLLGRGDLEGKPGQSLMLYDLPDTACERVLLVGCGKKDELDDRRYRQILANAASALDALHASSAVSYLAELEVKGRDLAWKARQLAEVTEHTLYRFDQLKSEKDKRRRKLARIILGLTERSEQTAAERGLKEGQAIAVGQHLVRDLGNLPGNICTPTYLAEQAKLLADSDTRFSLQVLEREDMEKLGMGALLSVAKGSVQPPKLIVLEYRNGGDAKPIALIGKGITFDTGGISIKPSADMDEMKFDMCGAASVLGTLKAVAQLELPLNVVGIIAAAENMPSGQASKPGDIVTSLSGQTVEILNTDAEGRLVLCDALTYAERFQPAAVVDIATLTGACVIALGRHPHGLFSNDDKLAQELLTASQAAADRAWQMPLWEDYQSQLDSNFADMANIGGRDAGAITAACFLSRFAKKYKWAHLDIAGTAWKTGKEKGATGRPVPLLTQFLLSRAGQG
ncbi:MAG TPA: leucyl aminopeptidase [Candidatus Competibacteraceae bacterium]|nr:leucyl aminopeptidase [Candidatus Competibacteraceae bacterium]